LNGKKKRIISLKEGEEKNAKHLKHAKEALLSFRNFSLLSENSSFENFLNENTKKLISGSKNSSS
jgi:hypothetical protein